MLVVASCTPEAPNPTLEPEKAILGKWKLIEKSHSPYVYHHTDFNGYSISPYDDSGLYPSLRNNGYTEYLLDSLIKWHSEDLSYSIILPEKYWIDTVTTLLYVKVRYDDETVEVYSYDYRFYDDRMGLDDQCECIISNVCIFQRKK